MASTRPNWALNLPSGPSWYERWYEFDHDTDLAHFVPSITTDNAAWGGSIVTQDGAFGECLLTNDSNDDDAIEMQERYESIRFNGLGKTYYICGRLKVSDATQSDCMFGACKRDTSAITLVSDGIFFLKDDGDTNIDARVAYNATAQGDYTSGLAGATLDTSYHTYVIRVITDATTLGIGTAVFYFDGTAIATLGGPTSSILPHDEELALFFGIRNGEAAAKTLTVDNVGFICER